MYSSQEFLRNKQQAYQSVLPIGNEEHGFMHKMGDMGSILLDERLPNIEQIKGLPDAEKRKLLDQLKVNYNWNEPKPLDLDSWNQTKQWHLNKRHLGKKNINMRRAKLTALMGLLD